MWYDYEKVDKDLILQLKREVKKIDGIYIKNILSIRYYDDDVIVYEYYENNYSKCKGIRAIKEVNRLK